MLYTMEKMVSIYVNNFPTSAGEVVVGGEIGSLLNLLRESVKSKLFSLFSFICLHGLRRVVGMGENKIELI